MRTAVLVSATFIAALHVLPHAGTGQSDLAPGLLQEMKMLEATRNDAIRRKDLETIQRLYAEDFSGVGSTGQRVNRTELLEVFTRQPDGFVGGSDEIAIRPLGPEAVIVSGRLTITRPRDPQSPEVVSRFTHIFQRRDGRWQMIVGQSTPVLASR